MNKKIVKLGIICILFLTIISCASNTIKLKPIATISTDTSGVGYIYGALYMIRRALGNDTTTLHYENKESEMSYAIKSFGVTDKKFSNGTTDIALYALPVGKYTVQLIDFHANSGDYILTFSAYEPDIRKLYPDIVAEFEIKENEALYFGRIALIRFKNALRSKQQNNTFDKYEEDTNFIKTKYPALKEYTFTNLKGIDN